MKKGSALYHVESMIKETNSIIDSGIHIIFVNGAYRGNDELGSLISDMHSTNYKDIKNDSLKEAMKDIQIGKGGYKNMCDVSKKLVEYGANSMRDELIVKMYNNKATLEFISSITDLTIDEVKQVLKENGVELE